MGSANLKFVRTTSDMNTLVTRSSRLLKRMQKQVSKHRFIISVLNKIFGKHFTVFNVVTDTAANLSNLFHSFELELYIYTFACCIVCFSCLFFCLFVCGYHVVISSVSSIFVYVFAFIYVAIGWHFVL